MFEYEVVNRRGLQDVTQFPEDFVPDKIVLNKPQNKFCIYSSNYILVADFPSRYSNVKNIHHNQANLQKP